MNERKGHIQTGTGPGEFGPDYSDRKAFHLDYHADWEHPTHDTMGKPLQMERAPHRQKAWNEQQMQKLDEAGRHRSEWAYSAYDGRQDGEIPHGAGYQELPRRTPYPSHVIEAYNIDEHIKRTRQTPLTKEEIEERHAELKRKQDV